MGIPLAALAVQQPPSPLKQYGEVLGIQGAQQEQQLRQQQIQGAQLQNQQHQLQLQDQQAVTAAMKNWDGKDIEELPGLVLKQGGSAQAVFGLKNQIIEEKKNLAQADEATLGNQAKTNDLIAGHIEAVKGAPAEQKQQAYSNAISDLQQKGLIKPGMMSAQYPGDDALNLIEKSFMGQKQIVEQEQNERKIKASETEAGAVAQKAQTELQEAPSKIAEQQANALKAQKETAQLGQVTPLEKYKQGQENYRAQISRQAGFDMQLQKNGLEQMDKIWTDPQHGYTQFLAQANATKSAVAKAVQDKDPNELAASLAPLMTVLGVNSFAGVHRISPQEAEAAGKFGSVYRRINQILDTAAQGKLNADSGKEMTQLIDGLIDAKHESLVGASKLIAGNGHLDQDKTQVLNKRGDVDTLGNVVRASANPPIARPSTATMKVPGDDGRWHWSDGKQDLGIAE